LLRLRPIPKLSGACGAVISWGGFA